MTGSASEQLDDIGPAGPAGQTDSNGSVQAGKLGTQPSRGVHAQFCKAYADICALGSGMRRDPAIRLRKSEALDSHADPRAHHPRTPDVGIGILVAMLCYRASKTIEYYGEYIGHGQSKMAFALNHPGARFYGQVLKVAKAHDMEPSVFIKTAHANLTTSVLYNCHGVDADSGRRFHCWITDRTIPLDEFCRFDRAIKTKCSLAAFCCMLNSAMHGL